MKAHRQSTGSKLETRIVRRDGGYFLNLTENSITVELGSFDNEESVMIALCEYKRQRNVNKRLVRTERTWNNILHREAQKGLI